MQNFLDWKFEKISNLDENFGKFHNRENIQYFTSILIKIEKNGGETNILANLYKICIFFWTGFEKAGVENGLVI